MDWFLEQCGIGLDYSTWEVLHSKRRTRNRREIDIFTEGFDIEKNEVWALLIENKLDTDEQPDQAESYREELNRHYDGHEVSKTVLLCPSEYARCNNEFADKFDHVVTYQEISNFFKSRGDKISTEGRRANFKADCFSQAVTKARRGYSKIGNKRIRDFNTDYVELMKKTSPSLKPGASMLGPTKPDESVSMILDVNATLSELPKDIRPRRFAIELGKNDSRRANYVAITFGGWGKYKDLIEQDFHKLEKSNLLNFMDFSFAAKKPTKTRPKPGLVISSRTCPVDNQSNVKDQKDLVIDGFRKAEIMKEFLVENRQSLYRWRDYCVDLTASS